MFDGQKVPEVDDLTAKVGVTTRVVGCRAGCCLPPAACCLADSTPVRYGCPLPPVSTPSPLPPSPPSCLQITEEIKSILGTVSNGAQDMVAAAREAALKVLSAGKTGAAATAAPAFSFS